MKLLILITTHAKSIWKRIILDTWWNDLPSTVAAYFVEGSPGAPSHIEGNFLYLDCKGDYRSCPKRYLMSLQWFANSDFTHVFIVDDDSYLVVPRLLTAEYGDYHGCYFGCCPLHCYVHGGPGIMLSMAAARRIAEYPLDCSIVRYCYHGDAMVGKIAREFGIEATYDPRFCCGEKQHLRKAYIPTQWNDLISIHKQEPKVWYFLHRHFIRFR